MDSLEAVRATFDQGGIGLVLIGMPGYGETPDPPPLDLLPHRFRAQFPGLERRRGAPPSCRRMAGFLHHPPFAEEATSALIRITEGNFRLLDRLLSQLQRIARLNSLSSITAQAADAACESLLIGR